MSGVILLHGLFPESEPADAFRAARALANAEMTGPRVLVTVQDTGGAFGTAPFDPANAWAGGIAALARTFAQEFPDSATKAIDIDFGLHTKADLVDALANEVLYGGPELEVGLGAAGRVTLVNHRREARAGGFSLASSDVIVVSGGARGVTATTVMALGKRFPCRFALLGRTPLAAEPAEAQGIPDDDAALKRALMLAARARGEKVSPRDLGKQVSRILAGREIRATVAKLESVGCQARYDAVDVTNTQGLGRLFGDLRRSWGPITGIIHGAGVIQDRFIAEKTDEQFNLVYNTKIGGLKALMAATAHDPLKLILCFSSVAARTGNQGQVDYAMANEVLNRFCDAEALRRPQAVVRSLGWGPWAGGMVTPSLKARFEALGVPLIGLADGAQMLVDEVIAGPGRPTSVVLGGEPRPEALLHDDNAEVQPVAVEVIVSPDRQPWLEDHTVEGVPVVPVALVVEWFTGLARALRPDATVQALEGLEVHRGVRLEDWPGATTLQLEARDHGNTIGLLLLDDSGRRLYSARARVGAEEVRPAAPVVGSHAPWTGNGLYDGDVLFHGPQLQVLTAVDGVDASGAVGQLRHADLESIEHTDVGAVDGALQLALLWSKASHGGASLPMGVDEIHFHGAVSPLADISGRALLVGRKTAGAIHTADVTLVDTNGVPRVTLTGVRTVRRP